MTRGADRTASARLLARVRDGWGRAVRRQSDFSLVSALVTGVLLATLLVDLGVGHPHLGRWQVTVWIIGCLVFTAMPLALGVRYPRAMGLVMTAVMAMWSGYCVWSTVHAHTELAAFFQSVMLALYLGWFYRPAIARVALATIFLSILAALLLRAEPATSNYSTPLVFVHALAISIFCLEAGSSLRRRAEQRANFDPLTGVLNRRGLSARAPEVLENGLRAGEPMTVAVVDFDDFKAVNDAGGHAAGDRALRETAQTWSRGLGTQDLVARTGGDEFVLVMHAAPEEANRCLAELANSVPYSWTWGLAGMRAGDTIDELMTRADVRMYDVKGRRQAEPGDSG